MSILTIIQELLIDVILLFNNFFNHNIRDSESGFVSLIWTTSVAIGWVKFLFEFKNLIDFFVRHFLWGVLYQLFWKSYAETKDLFYIYGGTKNVRRRQYTRNS